MVEHIRDEPLDSDVGELYSTISEGDMQLAGSGPRAGTLEIGSWSSNLLSPSIFARIRGFRAVFARHRPEDLNIDQVCNP